MTVFIKTLSVLPLTETIAASATISSWTRLFCQVRLAPKVVASLGLVSPGAATDGVTLFFLQKLTTFFIHCPLEIDDLFLSSPHHSHLPASFIQCFFLNWATKNHFIWVSTPWMVSPGVVCPHPLVTPLSTGGIFSLAYLSCWLANGVKPHIKWHIQLFSNWPISVLAPAHICCV